MSQHTPHRIKRHTDSAGWCLLAIFLGLIQAVMECITDYNYPGSLTAMYACIAFGTVLFVPFYFRLKQWARPVYIVCVLLMTLPWAFPDERSAFALRINTIPIGCTVQQLENAMQPYWERSRTFDEPSAVTFTRQPLPNHPLPSNFTGDLYFTFRTEHKYYDFAVVKVQKGTVTETLLYID